LAQRYNLFIGHTQLSKHLSVVFAKARRPTAHDHFCRESRRRTRLAQAAGSRVVTFKQNIASENLRMVDDLITRKDGRAGHTLALQPLKPFLSRARP
jgi:hypothetical protein